MPPEVFAHKKSPRLSQRASLFKMVDDVLVKEDCRPMNLIVASSMTIDIPHSLFPDLCQTLCGGLEKMWVQQYGEFTKHPGPGIKPGLFFVEFSPALLI